MAAYQAGGDVTPPVGAPPARPESRHFTAQRDGVRVLFGTGAEGRLAPEIDRLGARTVLVVGSPRRVHDLQRIAGALGERCVGVWAKAREHVPSPVAEAARFEATRLRADAVVAFGGGSSVGLGKAIALTNPVTLIAVPTTYAGSEMTSVYGITDGGRKRTGRDERVRPRLVLYDPALTLALSPEVTRSSLFNAMAHAVEALYAPGVAAGAVDDAQQAVASLGRSLAELADDPGNPAARSEALYGAYLSGSVLAVTPMGLHHQICHVLGGTFGLPHAPTHAVVLPHVVRFNSEAAGPAVRKVAAALGASDAAAAIYDLARRVGAEGRLAALGFRASDVEPAATVLMEHPYPNPRPPDKDALIRLLDDALVGRRPEIP